MQMVLASIELNGSSGQQSGLLANEFVGGQQDGAGDMEHRVVQMVGYMKERLNQSLRVPKLARMVGVSQSHFFAVFKKQTGFAPIDFFTRMRMTRACELLDSTSLSVKEIAAALGYDDQFYFSRVFKSVNRISPSKYRSINLKRREQVQGFCPALPTHRLDALVERATH